MSGITIVTGAPGAGKTTLSRRAAQADPLGLHLPADVFDTFPAYPVSPGLPEAPAQNGAVIAAAAARQGSLHWTLRGSRQQLAKR